MFPNVSLCTLFETIVAFPGFEGGGAKTFACVLRAQNFSHAPKMLTTPLIKHVLADEEGCFRLNSDEKLLFWERILEASKFIVGSSFQSSIISNNICR